MRIVGADDAAASDDALVAAARLGDERAFENLYRRYRADIRAFCSRSLSDPHITDDVTQETFLRAFRHIGQFERGRPLRPWLVTIAKRLCIDEMRGTDRRAALGRSLVFAADGGYDATSEEALANVERQRLNGVISRALAALRPRDRNVFVLQTIEGWSHEEIAEEHGMSVHAVRNLAWRARRALRRSLGDEHTRRWTWIFAVCRPRLMRRGPGGRGRKWRLRSWIDGHLQDAAVERAAAIVLGLAAASATVVGGAAPHRQPHTAVVFGSVAARPIGETRAAPSKSVRDADRPDHSYRPAPPRPVAAAVSIGGNHEGAAAPSGATARVTVRTPDGRTLVWYDQDASCGGQGRELLPQAGPVSAVC